MKINNYYNNHPEDVKGYDTKKLRERFLLESFFEKDEIVLHYSHHDRIIAGGVMPAGKTLKLADTNVLGTEYFLQRREMGVINLGGEGQIVVDGQKLLLQKFDGAYVPKGTQSLEFVSTNSQEPAKFYINSAPAHTRYELVHIPFKNASPRKLGDKKTINERTIYMYLNQSVCKTCQLQMGLTIMEEGNTFNTMPAHTHDRRMEVYFYFNLQQDNVVFHLMGEPSETRHIVVRNEQGIISPSWSVHSGVGTSNYAFIWGMCGENQTYDDMQPVKMTELF